MRIPSKASRPVAALTVAVLLGACGGSLAARSNAPAPSGAIPTDGKTARTTPALGKAAAAALLNWPEFGLDPQRTDASALSTGITAANVGRLHRRTVALPGTVDSSPIYAHAVSIGGATRNVVVVTTTYGKTLAIDADSRSVLWAFTPAGYLRWAGSAQITTTSPLLDPGGGWVYAASPNGLIHKLALASGAEAAGWPVAVSRDATHEKLAAALNVDGRYLLAATGGYFGDAPPYQGHLVAIDRGSGKVAAVFNSLCANRRRILAPSSCPASDSAILSRGGAVVERGGRRLLISTGNGPWNGRTNFGDSVIELSFPGLPPRQAYAPVEQQQLSESDTDLGSSSPALLGQDRVLIAGKDGTMRVLSLSRLDGRSASLPSKLGGEIQRLPLPGGGQAFSSPAVWQATRGHASAATKNRRTAIKRGGAAVIVFIGAESATAAYRLRRGRLSLLWQNSNPGTSPVFAGGLLYVYDPAGGGIDVYRPSSGTPIAKLPGSPGHWNSPVVVDGHVVEPEGNANDHRLNGTLDIFTAG